MRQDLAWWETALALRKLGDLCPAYGAWDYNNCDQAVNLALANQTCSTTAGYGWAERLWDRPRAPDCPTRGCSGDEHGPGRRACQIIMLELSPRIA